MTNPTESEPEVPDGTKRPQIRVHDLVRQYLWRLKKDEGKTFSELLDECFPEDWEDVEIGISDENQGHIKPTPEVHEQIHSMTGKRVRMGDVVTLFVLLEAAERGDMDEAAEMAENVPVAIIDVLEAVGDFVPEDQQ